MYIEISFKLLHGIKDEEALPKVADAPAVKPGGKGRGRPSKTATRKGFEGKGKGRGKDGKAGKGKLDQGNDKLDQDDKGVTPDHDPASSKRSAPKSEDKLSPPNKQQVKNEELWQVKDEIPDGPDQPKGHRRKRNRNLTRSTTNSAMGESPSGPSKTCKTEGTGTPIGTPVLAPRNLATSLGDPTPDAQVQTPLTPLRNYTTGETGGTCTQLDIASQPQTEDDDDDHDAKLITLVAGAAPPKPPAKQHATTSDNGVRAEAAVAPAPIQEPKVVENIEEAPAGTSPGTALEAAVAPWDSFHQWLAAAPIQPGTAIEAAVEAAVTAIETAAAAPIQETKVVENTAGAPADTSPGTAIAAQAGNKEEAAKAEANPGGLTMAAQDGLANADPTVSTTPVEGEQAATRPGGNVQAAATVRGKQELAPAPPTPAPSTPASSTAGQAGSTPSGSTPSGSTPGSVPAPSLASHNKEPEIESTIPGGAEQAGVPRGPNKAPYKVDPELLKLVVDASCPGDVPVKERNKLYAALGRAAKMEACPPAALARYTKDRQDPTNMFKLLKEWVLDPCWGKVQLREEHFRI